MTLVPAVTFTVSGNAAWVSTLGPDQGLAQIQVDNGKPEVVDTYSPTVQTGRVVCCHATPSSNEDVVLPETPPEQVGELAVDAVAAGHVHQQWLRRFGRTLWFCVGAIGIGPWCEYAVVDDESLAVEFRRVPFDVEELVEEARADDFPFFDRWVQSWKE